MIRGNHGGQTSPALRNNRIAMKKISKTRFMYTSFFLLLAAVIFFRFQADAFSGTTPDSKDIKGQLIASDVKPDGSAPAEVNALAEAGKFDLTKIEDPTVWVLIFLFLVAIAVSIERAFVFYKNKGKNDKLIRLLTEGLARNSDNPHDLIKHIRHPRYGMEGRVAAKTLEGWPFGEQSMREFAQAAMEAERRRLNRWLVILSTLGNNTPFIGLLGTVLGIMRAFSDLAMVGDAGPAVVMKGISEALIATAFGLGVAIPCVISYNIFSTMVKSKLSNAEEIIDIMTGVRAAFEKEGLAGVQLYAKEAHSTTTGQLILNEKDLADMKMASE